MSEQVAEAVDVATLDPDKTTLHSNQTIVIIVMLL